MTHHLYSGRPLVQGCEFEVDGLVAAQTMCEWNKDAVQKRIFARQSAASCGSFCIAEYSGTHAQRRASNSTAKCGGSNSDIGVVADTLHFPSGIPGANKG